MNYVIEKSKYVPLFILKLECFFSITYCILKINFANSFLNLILDIECLFSIAACGQRKSAAPSAGEDQVKTWKDCTAVGEV